MLSVVKSASLVNQKTVPCIYTSSGISQCVSPHLASLDPSGHYYPGFYSIWQSELWRRLCWACAGYKPIRNATSGPRLWDLRAGFELWSTRVEAFCGLCANHSWGLPQIFFLAHAHSPAWGDSALALHFHHGVTLSYGHGGGLVRGLQERLPV